MTARALGGADRDDDPPEHPSRASWYETSSRPRPFSWPRSSRARSRPRCRRVHGPLHAHRGQHAGRPSRLAAVAAAIPALPKPLIAMANLARDSGVPWSLQPDWKILEAALIYEDSTLMGSTNDKNFLRYMREDSGLPSIRTPMRTMATTTPTSRTCSITGGWRHDRDRRHIWVPIYRSSRSGTASRGPAAWTALSRRLVAGRHPHGKRHAESRERSGLSGIWRPQDRTTTSCTIRTATSPRSASSGARSSAFPSWSALSHRCHLHRVHAHHLVSHPPSGDH